MQRRGGELELLIPRGTCEDDVGIVYAGGALEIEHHDELQLSALLRPTPPVVHVVLVERVPPADDEALEARLGERGAHGGGTARDRIVEWSCFLLELGRIEPAAGHEARLVLPHIGGDTPAQLPDIARQAGDER